MSGKVTSKVILGAAILVGSGLIYGCVGGGDTDGGKASNSGDGTQYIPNGLGTISLDVNDEIMQVSEITGFRVRVADSTGAGIPLTRVSCDTEKGLSIIEPTTGTEITDAAGEISGKLGCASPGSYLFGCRLPVGGNKRTFLTVRCSGPIPTGFEGFPGASGGGLGTGGNSQNGDGGNGGTDTGGVTITSVTFDDGFGETVSIDTAEETDCNGDGSTTTTDIEPYFDTKISITAQNNTNQTVTFSGYSYSIPGVFTSNEISLSAGTLVVPDGSEVTLNSLFAKAGAAQKFFITSSSAIGSLGVKNIEITLYGSNDLGEDVTVTTSTVASFDDYNHC